jgi:hypothetical protein
MSEKCWKNVGKMSEKYQKNVGKLSKKCRKVSKVDKMSENCQKNVGKMLKKCGENVEQNDEKMLENCQKLLKKCRLIKKGILTFLIACMYYVHSALDVCDKNTLKRSWTSLCLLLSKLRRSSPSNRHSSNTQVYVLFGNNPPIFFGGSATPCASPPRWPSIFSDHSFWIHHPVHQDDRHLLAHAVASDFSATWQFLSKRTIGNNPPILNVPSSLLKANAQSTLPQVSL